jgi:hypothetical protein
MIGSSLTRRLMLSAPHVAHRELKSSSLADLGAPAFGVRGVLPTNQVVFPDREVDGEGVAGDVGSQAGDSSALTTPTVTAGMPRSSMRPVASPGNERLNSVRGCGCRCAFCATWPAGTGNCAVGSPRGDLGEVRSSSGVIRKPALVTVLSVRPLSPWPSRGWPGGSRCRAAARAAGAVRGGGGRGRRHRPPFP